jgi:hypothetical protein
MTKKKKSPKHVFLVWTCFPEYVDMYLIPLEGLEKREKLWLRRCHGNLINASDTVFNGDYTQEQIDEALTMVSALISNPNAEWLAKDPEYFERQAESYKMSVEEFTDLYGSWHEHKLELVKPKTLPRARLIRSGFIM